MKNDQFQLSIYIIISIALHLIIFVLFHFGFTNFKKLEPQEQIVTFEIVPMDDISNIKTQKVQRENEIIEEKAKKVQKSKVEEEKTPVKEATPTPKPEEKKEEIIIKEKKIEEKKEKKIEQDKPATKKTPDKKPPTKKKKTPTNNEMDALLKTLEKESKGKEERSKKRTTGEKSDAIEEAIGKFNEDKPLSISEMQYIKHQIQDRWNVPIGVQNAVGIIITLHIALKVDGTVEQVKVKETICPEVSEIVCRAAVDSAVRAVWQASPIRNLSQERYNTWKAFHINFDPRDAL